jgi:hypothetical protein
VTLQFSTRLLEKYLAPGINECRPANIDNLNAEISDTSWIENHFLNSIFGPTLNETWRARFVVLAFRAKTALIAYERSRLACESFIANSIDGNPAAGSYFEAIAEWEVVILNLNHAADVFRQFDGSSFQEEDDVKKVKWISNRIKHVAEDIENGLHTDLTVPMWMTSSGLKTRVAEISFDEVADCLRSLIKIVDEIQNPTAMLQAQSS